ncbi:hypothetical protein B0E52_09920 [Rhodanobacter sp. C06]|uniref:hypothetical protein n=1 Tax=Rhodanobacter sp. C06 TaxID=1945854 RepID=UPI000984F033|nr:hypothetical protein [Rhodanobacter sp. C06]OOG42311.1 hypothetical protein B0E52_09920 [Rhodanobacter sp. C06]
MLRLILGAPTLCIVISLFSWIEWAAQGFAPELSPRHWLDYHGALFLGMSFAGGVIALLASALLWTFGIIAMAFGEGLLRALRRRRGY